MAICDSSIVIMHFVLNVESNLRPQAGSGLFDLLVIGWEGTGDKSVCYI